MPIGKPLSTTRGNDGKGTGGWGVWKGRLGQERAIAWGQPTDASPDPWCASPTCVENGPTPVAVFLHKSPVREDFSANLAWMKYLKTEDFYHELLSCLRGGGGMESLSFFLSFFRQRKLTLKIGRWGWIFWALSAQAFPILFPCFSCLLEELRQSVSRLWMPAARFTIIEWKIWMWPTKIQFPQILHIAEEKMKPREREDTEDRNRP